MTKKRLIADQPALAPTSGNGDLPQRRKTENLPGGLYYFEDELETRGVLQADVVTCTGWLLEVLKIEAGAISFFSGAREIEAPFTQLAIFYPPFTFTRPCFRNVKAVLKGIAGTTALPAKFSARPFVFEADFIKSPKSLSEAVEILEASRDRRFIDANPQASRLALKTKKLIDENYRIYPSIARIAARLKVSHEHLTRQFKRDFGISPNAYLHQLRIADATFRLLRGEAIIDVSGDVGYNDLSRFYKQFRKSNAASPGFCRAKNRVDRVKRVD